MRLVYDISHQGNQEALGEGMDTSKEYVKMCEKSKEIQNEAYKHQGNFDMWLCANCRGIDQCDCWQGVWLPRQDQLLNMAFEGISPDGIIGLLNDWRNYNYELGLKTMEQFLLAHLMKKKFKKVWNGDTWMPST